MNLKFRQVLSFSLTEDICRYEVEDGVFGDGSYSDFLDPGTKANCRASVENRLYDNPPAIGFTYRKSPEKCRILASNDPFENDKNQHLSSSNELHTLRCGIWRK